ncbi:DUF6082 family protein [Streptomyces tubercidicus]|uniref:DUF6082 family protein n=1 Tax=Streptomyces tubercidicus TaxID=47759 RepID=UPI0036BDCE38
MTTTVEKIHDDAEVLALVETALSWDVHGADLPAVADALSMAQEFTSYGRIIVDELRTQCLNIVADSDVAARAAATLGEASRRLYLRPLAGSAAPRSAAQRAQNLARLVQSLLRAVEQVNEEFLTLLTTHPELAALWVPEALDPEEEDLTPEQYVQLLNANQQIAALGLRHRLGIARGQRLSYLAEYLMGREHCRKYWARFGSFREQEASGDRPREGFHEVMNAAYRARQKDKPADA